jgi:hypothetical protein
MEEMIEDFSQENAEIWEKLLKIIDLMTQKPICSKRKNRGGMDGEHERLMMSLRMNAEFVSHGQCMISSIPFEVMPVHKERLPGDLERLFAYSSSLPTKISILTRYATSLETNVTA